MMMGMGVFVKQVYEEIDGQCIKCSHRELFSEMMEIYVVYVMRRIYSSKS